MRVATPRRARRGFTLAETLVALLLVAGATGLFYQMVSANADATRAAEQRRIAWLVAQSVMASAHAGDALGASGTSAGFGWRIDRRRSGGGARATGPGFVALTVGVRPAGSARPIVELRTLELAGTTP